MSDEKPLEIQILRNLKFVDSGKTRLWCDTVILDPPRGEDRLPCETNTVRGFIFESGDLTRLFIRFYDIGKTAEYLPDHGDPKSGKLRVDDEWFDVYGESPGIVNETKTFEGGYMELWKYLESEGKKCKNY